MINSLIRAFPQRTESGIRANGPANTDVIMSVREL